MHLRFIHVVPNGRISSFINSWIIFSWTEIAELLYPFIHQQTQILSLSYNASVNMGLQISFWTRAFVSFVYIPRAEMLDPIALLFLILWESFSAPAPLYKPTSSAQGSLFPTSGPAFVISSLFTILRSVKWHLTVVLICISLMIRDIEHSFLCLLSFHISSLQKCLFRALPMFSWIAWSLFAIELYEFIIYFEYEFLTRYAVCK